MYDGLKCLPFQSAHAPVPEQRAVEEADPQQTGRIAAGTVPVNPPAESPVIGVGETRLVATGAADGGIPAEDGIEEEAFTEGDPFPSLPLQQDELLAEPFPEHGRGRLVAPVDALGLGVPDIEGGIILATEYPGDVS